MTAPPLDTEPGAAARRYHAEYGSILPHIDLDAGCAPPKSYPLAPLTALPYPPRAAARFDLGTAAGLGDLLALLYGMTRIAWAHSGVGPARPVPSGGGAYPGEVYAASAGVGLSHYLPGAHALESLSRRDRRAEILGCLESAPDVQPELLLVLTSMHAANTARYGEFGHRLQALDSGVLAGQALALLRAAGSAPRAHTRFDEQELGRILGLEPAAESVRAVITAWPVEAGAPPVPVPGAAARHTARHGFRPDPIARSTVDEILRAASADSPTDVRAHTVEGGAEVELYVLATRVDGLAAGCYRHDPAGGDLRRVGHGPAPGTLFPAGGPGERAWFEAAGAVLITGDYEHGYPVHGDRWYRMLNLEAGIAGQRLCLAAAAGGLGVGLRCDFLLDGADRLLKAAPDRTVLLAALIGPERTAGAYEDQPLRPGDRR